ncbi:MAG: acetyl-CoA carboxylase carboxyltransferase subunit alpha [Armatimonadetes bacterium]|nr:acetyl-CoA carboxylase carboxyltransferase subunit alpha [Candidatus Hippobium faecium]
MTQKTLNDFEKQIAEIEKHIDILRQDAINKGEDSTEELKDIEQKRDQLLKEFFSDMDAWDNALLARHQKRPYTLDYVRSIFDEFIELHGDRLFGDDRAMVCGIGNIGNIQAAFVGQQKGRDLKDRQYRNFGSARPEGYRKAMRIMKLAEKYRRPIICFVDTPAADCSVGAEERGISEAIARNMMDMMCLSVPVIAVVIGEGGSGGAIGIAVANRVAMLEHSIYSVIPPEGCAAILWRDPSKAKDAAQALKINAQNAKELGVVDDIIPEPLGGAHRNAEETAQNIKSYIIETLSELNKLSGDELAEERYKKFRNFGRFVEA